MDSRSLRTVALTLAVGALLLTSTGEASAFGGVEPVGWGASGGSTREVRTGASVTIATKDYVENCPNCGPGGTPRDIPRCSYVDIVLISPVAGASSYSVTVNDTRLGVRSISGSPPFPREINGIPVPPNTLGGLSSGAGPGPCGSSQNTRYTVLRAVAILDTKPRIVGTVRRSDGSGIPGARVVARGPRTASATTGTDGTYSMRVAKGRYTVSARGFCVAGGGCRPSRTVTVGDGPQQVDFERDLKLAVTGVVRDEFGRRLPGVRLSLRGPEADTATSGVSGGYRLEVGRAGTYELTATGSGRGPNERYYIVQNGAPTEGTAADVTLSEQVRSVVVGWELDRRLQFTLTTHDPARADGFTKAVATLRAVTQRGDPAPGVQLNVEPPSSLSPKAVICSTGGSSRPLWPSVHGDGSIHGGAGLPRGPDTTTDGNGEVRFRIYPGTEPGVFRIGGSRPPAGSPAYSSFSLTIPFVGTQSRQVNGRTIAQGLLFGGVGLGVGASPAVLFEALAGRQLDGGSGISGVDGVPVITPSGRGGVAFYSRGDVPVHSGSHPRVIGATDGAFVLDGSAASRVNPSTVLPTLREWARGEIVVVNTSDPRTYLGWPVPTTANGGLGACLTSALPGDVFHVSAHSPVRILLTDARGRRLGVDAAGRRHAGLPGATYRIGTDSFLVAPTGSYRLTVVGTGTGPVTLETRRDGRTTVARFLARRGAVTTLRLANGALPARFAFAGQTVRTAGGMPLVVRGLPRVLRVGQTRRVTLVVTDGLGRGVPAAVRVSGPAGTFTRFADDRGRLRLGLRPARRGVVRLTVRAADLLPAAARATAIR